MTREELLKTAKPILFNTEMVQAILDGRKTATRRLVKPQPAKESSVYRRASDMWIWKYASYDGDIKPTYLPGDILYVRETWRRAEVKCNGGAEFFYYADGFSDASAKPETGRKKWNPSIHMPKEAARIFPKVTDLRVERLQDMTVEDCKKEGIYDDYKTISQEYHDLLMRRAYPETFAKLWDSTIKKKDLNKYGWDANPFVWVIEFEKIEV